MNKYQCSYIRVIKNHIQYYFPCCDDVAIFIGCLSALETDYGSSDIYLKARNCFGMRKVVSRISTSYDSYKDHQCYGFSCSSIIDFFIWLQMAGFKRDHLFSLDKFCAKLRTSKYNPSPKYVDTILTIYKSYYHE